MGRGGEERGGGREFDEEGIVGWLTCFLSLVPLSTFHNSHLIIRLSHSPPALISLLLSTRSDLPRLTYIHSPVLPLTHIDSCRLSRALGKTRLLFIELRNDESIRCMG